MHFVGTDPMADCTRTKWPLYSEDRLVTAAEAIKDGHEKRRQKLLLLFCRTYILDLDYCFVRAAGGIEYNRRAEQ